MNEAGQSDAALEARLQRTMLLLALGGVVVGGLLYSWRVATGFALGSVLSYVNLRWLRKSLRALLGSAAAAGAADSTVARPRWNASRYVLRYLLIAAIVYAAVNLNLVSVAATLVGLCVFAAAIVTEGFTQLFFAIVKREEN